MTTMNVIFKNIGIKKIKIKLKYKRSVNIYFFIFFFFHFFFKKIKFFIY